MKVVYEAGAIKAMNRLPANDRDALRRKLAAYAETGAGDVVKLTGRDRWRLRHGDWRAIFKIESDLIVVQIAHRREVYR